MEPHAPYRPEPYYYGLFLAPGEEPPPIPRERPDRIDPEEFGSRDFYKYDGEIIRADDNLQRFISKLKTLGVYDDTLLIVTADHGEAFGEHEQDYGHGGKPYNPVTRIPFIVHLPGLVPSGRVVEDPVQILDIAPTVLEAFGLAVPEQFQGSSLVPLLAGRDAELEDRTIFSHARGVTAAVRGRWKLIHDPEAGHDRLYDLRTDPGERTDLGEERPSIAAGLVAGIAHYLERQERLGAEVQAREQEATVQWSVGELEALRAIGYVE
jgi:arylsulfatase A-like enzyme